MNRRYRWWSGLPSKRYPRKLKKQYGAITKKEFRLFRRKYKHHVGKFGKPSNTDDLIKLYYQLGRFGKNTYEDFVIRMEDLHSIIEPIS